jgi:hypothetical protein
LLEVLVAIFIMGVGTLAILVLFPLGALNMARALKDDRCGTIAANADAMAISKDLKTDASIVDSNTPPAYNFYQTPPAGFTAADPSGPSYPIFVDPYFIKAGSPTTLGSVPTGYTYASSPILRVAPSWIQNLLSNASTAQAGADATDRWFSLLDDLTFKKNGEPLVNAAGNLERQGYYTWAYLLRRQQTGQAATCELDVVVYSGRSVQVPVMERGYAALSPNGKNPPTNPLGYPAYGETSVVLTWQQGDVEPELRRGQWLLDASYQTHTIAPNVTPPGPTYGAAAGHFYRVMEAVKLTQFSLQVEISPPLRDPLPDLSGRGNGGTTTVAPWFIVMDSAVEVFERGIGR